MSRFRTLALLFLFVLATAAAYAQEAPYFVTYDHHLEEAGNLELETSSTIGKARSGQNSFFAPWSEFEYGMTGWWTSEVYLEGQSTRHDSTLFTGWRWENRFRLLSQEHRVNPVLYFEYENINEASRIMKEVVGHADSEQEPNAVLRGERDQELEGKLILSSNVGNWNFAENFITEKNLSKNEGVEFGYSLGVSRPLGGLATGSDCHFCRENFSAGLEMYGGLGSTQDLSLRETAHYIAPVLAWHLTDNSTIRISPGFGLTHTSQPFLLRVGYSYEISGFGQRLARLFKGGHS